MNAARTITLEVSGQLAPFTVPGQCVASSTDMRWTSLPGDPGTRITGFAESTERNGDNGCGGAGVNDYCTAEDAVFESEPFTGSKTVATTSESATLLTQSVVVGEIVRYRLELAVPRCQLQNLQLTDRLPDGLLILDDGTATIAFVTDGGAGTMTSTTVEDPAPGVFPDLHLLGNEFSVDSVVPEFPIPSGAIPNPPLGVGDDLIIEFGDLVNVEQDPSSEFILVEFNALVTNTAGIQATTPLPNDFLVSLSGAPLVTFPSAVIVMAEPVVGGLTKQLVEPDDVTPTEGPFVGGDTLRYRIDLSNSVGPDVSTAYDVVVQDAHRKL